MLRSHHVRDRGGQAEEAFKIPMMRVPANKAQQTQLVQRESCRTK
jgi:hypothetical protein